CLPFSLTLVDLLFRSVPTSLEEVAMLCGSSMFRRLFTIVIPVARYQIMALLILIFSVSWKEYFFAFLISTGLRTRTLPVLLASLYGGEALNWHLLCALSAILILPAAFVLLFGWKIKVAQVIITGSKG